MKKCSVLKYSSFLRIVKLWNLRFVESKILASYRTSRFEEPRMHTPRWHVNLASGTGIINWKDCTRELLNLPLLNPRIPFRPRHTEYPVYRRIFGDICVCARRGNMQRETRTWNIPKGTWEAVKPNPYLQLNYDKKFNIIWFCFLNKYLLNLI